MNGEGELKDENRRWRRVLDNKMNRNSHALELTRRRRYSSLVSYFVSLSFLLKFALHASVRSREAQASHGWRGRTLFLSYQLNNSLFPLNTRTHKSTRARTRAHTNEHARMHAHTQERTQEHPRCCCCCCCSCCGGGGLQQQHSSCCCGSGKEVQVHEQE